MLARHLALEQAVADGPLVLGNRVVLLENGPNTYAAMFNAIAAARDSINMETYILEDDEVGRRLADALIAKQQQGVQVNLIHDAVGTLGTKKEYFKRLGDAGINVLEFNPVNPLVAKAGWDGQPARPPQAPRRRRAQRGAGRHQHQQRLLEQRAGRLRQRLERRLARRRQERACRGATPTCSSKGRSSRRCRSSSWRRGKRRRASRSRRASTSLPCRRRATEVVRAIGSTPDDPFSQIYVTLISAINSAESEILVTNAYFVPDPQLMQALIDAAARGVDVKLILPSTTDSSLVFHAGRAHYEPLLRGGVKLYERREALLHAKTAVIDGVWATVGSTNLDWRSFLHNQELTAVILGQEFGAKMRAAFERDLAASDPVTLEAWQRRPVTTRAKEMFARLWEYWL